MNDCLKCGRYTLERYCSECGEKQPEILKKRICSNCQNWTAGEYCCKCGGNEFEIIETQRNIEMYAIKLDTFTCQLKYIKIKGISQ